MEEKNLQEIKEEPKEEEVKQEKPRGYYFAEVPTEFAKVIALDGKAVSTEELILAMANCLRANLGFKLE